MNANQPAFALESYQDKTLPNGKQLLHLNDLVGHTIRAAVTDPSGQYQCHAVFVTETDCWLALDAELAGCCIEDGIELKVCGDHWNKEAQTLSQYLSVADMRLANLATPGELAALQVIEDQKAATNKAEQVARLRLQLAELEGAGK